MNTSGQSVHTSPATGGGLPVDGGIGLLLELMEPAPLPSPVTAPGPGLLARAQDWTHRAAAWGEGPRGAWRAW
ncbi:hypothetical protein [Blastococcus saxobsidens]|uniref:Uncharacterized protein n=1 Tax=Blastococcus saxobsidens TaxID=138336 RepID=A0A4Q7YB17_9ACTN|nr:hypothetical protein [Blastococcus saxobsidens]RZU33391.1 hypothetical protein BKA19_3112 [Blastococcus saxobsidens]